MGGTGTVVRHGWETWPASSDQPRPRLQLALPRDSFDGGFSSTHQPGRSCVVTAELRSQVKDTAAQHMQRFAGKPCISRPVVLLCAPTWGMCGQSLSRFSEGAAARLKLQIMDRQQHGLREDYFPAGTVAAPGLFSIGPSIHLDAP